MTLDRSHVCSELPAVGAPVTLCSVNAKILPVLLLESPCSLQENLLTDVSLSWNVLGILC